MHAGISLTNYPRTRALPMEIGMPSRLTVENPHFWTGYIDTRTITDVSHARLQAESRLGTRRSSPGSGRSTQKNARCKQRARIPVKEVSHELRVQSKEIARNRQRIDFHIDMTAYAHARACPGSGTGSRPRVAPAESRAPTKTSRRWRDVRHDAHARTAQSITARDAGTLPCSDRASATTRSARSRTARSRTSRTFPRCRST